MNAADVWKWIDEQHANATIDETWRSAKDLGKAWGLQQQHAKVRADRLVQEGKLESRRVKQAGHWITYYKPKE